MTTSVEFSSDFMELEHSTMEDWMTQGRWRFSLSWMTGEAKLAKAKTLHLWFICHAIFYCVEKGIKKILRRLGNLSYFFTSCWYQIIQWENEREKRNSEFKSRSRRDFFFFRFTFYLVYDLRFITLAWAAESHTPHVYSLSVPLSQGRFIFLEKKKLIGLSKKKKIFVCKLISIHTWDEIFQQHRKKNSSIILHTLSTFKSM